MPVRGILLSTEEQAQIRALNMFGLNGVARHIGRWVYCDAVSTHIISSGALSRPIDKLRSNLVQTT